jgi:hypothetical protein
VIVPVHASVEALMMLSEDADICKSPVLSNASQLLNNAASANLQTKKANVPELLQQAKIKKEAKHASRLAPGSFVHKPQATTGYENHFWSLVTLFYFILFCSILFYIILFVLKEWMVL